MAEKRLLTTKVARGQAPSAHRRPGYPLSGCVPAEPDSVSPGRAKVTRRQSRNKIKVVIHPEGPATTGEPLNPGGSLFGADVGPFYAPITILITSNLPFGDWVQIFHGERMTAALLDRLTHRCHIFEMNGESYRFRESMKTKKLKKAE